jgi:hypothetical protein
MRISHDSISKNRQKSAEFLRFPPSGAGASYAHDGESNGVRRQIETSG